MGSLATLRCHRWRNAPVSSVLLKIKGVDLPRSRLTLGPLEGQAIVDRDLQFAAELSPCEPFVVRQHRASSTVVQRTQQVLPTH